MINSSFLVVTGEPGLFERWLPSIQPILSEEDELIIIESIGSGFDFENCLPCEVTLIKITRHSPRGDWPRMLNFGLRLAKKDLIYQFDSDKHLMNATQFRETSEQLHLSNDKLIVMGSILDHPYSGDDFSEGRKQTLDYSVCWGGNVSFLRKNMVFYDERFIDWGGSDREWAFRMIHEKGCSVVWNEGAKVRHVPHLLQVDHDSVEAHQNDRLIEELTQKPSLP